jgi:hypothetical protein
MGSSGAGLGGLFFGSERRHRGFSSAVDYRGHDMDHSGAPKKQVDSGDTPKRRWNGDVANCLRGSEIATK